MNVKPMLLQFIREELAGGEGAIDENASLIDTGILDSMALLRLIGFIEERIGVRVPDDEVVPDNFQSVAQIETLIQRLQARR